jgi:hypothetical protein
MRFRVKRLHRPASTSLSAAATRIRRLVALPCVGEVIQALGMRFFNQLASTVAQSCIAFIAARGDALTRSMQAKRVTVPSVIIGDLPSRMCIRT